MIEQTGYFPAPGGHRLFFRVYLPDSPVQDALLVFHGHGEHSGRYAKFAPVVDNGRTALAAFDFRGTGHSEGREVYVDTFADYESDAGAFVGFFRDRFSYQGKICLLAHSLGGLTALSWASKNADALKCLILSSPCLGLKIPKMLRAFNAFLNGLAPRWVYQNPVYPPHLTHNPQEMLDYKKDRLIKRKISVRLVDEMLKAMDAWRQRPAYEFGCPVHILMAGLERVVDSDATRRFYETLTAPEKSLKVFDDFYHEIFNEAGQEKVFADLVRILDRYREGAQHPPR